MPFARIPYAPPVLRGRLLVAATFCGVAVGFFSGCVQAPPSGTITPATSAEQFDARSLHDEGLRKFLEENLGYVPTSDWDFDALCWTAFYFNPSLELARAQWRTARASEEAVGERQNPTLTLTPGYNSTRTAGLSPWMPSMNLDFLLPTAGKRGHELRIARQDTEAARWSVLAAVWQLRSELRKDVNDLAAARQRARLGSQQAAVQEKLLALLEQRLEAGSIAAPEVSVARTALLRAQAAAADAENQAVAARSRVAARLGVPLASLGNVEILPPATLSALNPQLLAVARREALQTRGDVLSALAKYLSAEEAVALEVAKQYPDFHLGPGYQWDQGNNKWTLGVSFEIPVFHGNQKGIAEAVARRAEAVAQFDLVQAQAISSIDGAASALESSRAQVERLRQVQAELERQHAGVEQRLSLGGADQVEVLSARSETLAAQTALADAESILADAAGQLEDALQIPFPHLAAVVASPAAKPKSP